jgi:hypothetical protein
MKRFLVLFTFLWTICISAHSQAVGLADLKFGQSQIADSQWNVSSCMYTATCQIYSKQPGTAYKIPWTSGQIQWSAGDYIKFEANIVQTGSYCSFFNVFNICIGFQIPVYGRSTSNPWLAKQYNADGTLKTTMGAGHIINMGNDFFFFVGSDNNTGQLFSMTTGMNSTSGVTWTGTLNPTITQVDTLAATNGSTTPLAAGQVAAPTAPTLCCGGSSAQFNSDATNTAKVISFTGRTSSDSQVYIDQVGNSNTIEIIQSGTRNNYAKYQSNGSFNDVFIGQSSTNAAATNYTDLTVNGNSNTVTITQQSTGGVKGAFVNISDNNNTLLLQQKDSGSHYADVSISGGNKNVDILQQGSASHMTKIGLTGLPVDLSLSQSGSTQNFYSINFNCATVGGCPKISVTQGQ